jgi:uncharacterized protein
MLLAILMVVADGRVIMAETVFIDSREEMEQILQEEVLGFLGVTVSGQPYVVPLNYTYIDGKILFHCALDGKKLDAMRANPGVCFTVGRQSGEVRDHAGPPCHDDCDSVICYGTARLIEDLEERARVLNDFNRRYRPDAPDIAFERVEKCMAVVITVAEMTGRKERDRIRTHWRSIF